MPNPKKTVKFQEEAKKKDDAKKNSINLEELKKVTSNLQHAIHKKKTGTMSEIRRQVFERKLANIMAANKKITHMNGNKPPGTSLNDSHISKIMGLVKKYMDRPLTSKITRKNGSFSQHFENGFVTMYEDDYEREHSSHLPIKKKPDPEEDTKKHSFYWAPRLRKNPTKEEIEQRNEIIQLSKDYMALHRPGLNRSKRYYVIDPEYPNPKVKMSLFSRFMGRPSKKASTSRLSKKH